MLPTTKSLKLCRECSELSLLRRLRLKGHGRDRGAAVAAVDVVLASSEEVLRMLLVFILMGSCTRADVLSVVVGVVAQASALILSVLCVFELAELL